MFALSAQIIRGRQAGVASRGRRGGKQGGRNLKVNPERYMHSHLLQAGEGGGRDFYNKS